mmetsp:Transcript_48717/g.95248  ORF Transcript_48717/g.95248 Transcript_48717/m.95248 type:complete len:110 (+) Transcript_48717:200-529(+)
MTKPRRCASRSPKNISVHKGSPSRHKQECDDGVNPYEPAPHTSNNLDPYIYASRARSRHDRRNLQNTFKERVKPKIFNRPVGLPTDVLKNHLDLTSRIQRIQAPQPVPS